MNFFQLSTLLSFTLIQLNFNYCPVLCDLLEDIQLSQTDDDFWQWMWGSDANETDGQKTKEHIKEELEYHYGNLFSSLDDLKGLTEELDFHIFNLHDFDKNKLLDGLEMLSMLQRHDTGQHVHNTHTLAQNTAVIDMVLKTDDKNNDGFLDYNEFKSAKNKHNLKSL